MDRAAVLEEVAPLLNVKVVEADHKAAGVIPADDGFAIRPGPRRPSVKLSDAGLKALLEQTGLGAGAKKLDQRTFAQATNQLVGARPFSLLTRDGEVIDFVAPDKYRPINPERVLVAVEKAAPDVDYHKALILPDHTVRLETVTGRELEVVPQGHARTADIVRAGAIVQFSTLGLNYPIVQSYALRLWCTNGATSLQVLRQYEYGGAGAGEGDNMWQFFRQSVRDALGKADSMVDEWRQLAAEGIAPEHRSVVLEQLLKQAGIGGVDAETIHNRALEAPPQNQWEALNLITEHTSHRMGDGRKIARAQSGLAKYSQAAHDRVCPVCLTDRAAAQRN